MVGMPQGYCIDSTEVTASQYSAWLATTPSTTLMPSYCATSWKPSYRPGSGTGNYPVANVDWCDAYAYCKGVGKRLCGKIGGGANAFNDYANAGLSQWFGACSSGGLDTYPYGNTYGAQTCNGKDHGVGATVAVGSMTGCGSSVSGYTGVYDLSGNVYEWEDSCDGNTGQLDYCRLGGGSFGDSDVGLSLACGSLGISPRYYWNPQTGIRCCAL
jgi:formylglycine-generating enzyme required for sulfatase activity